MKKNKIPNMNNAGEVASEEAKVIKYFSSKKVQKVMSAEEYKAFVKKYDEMKGEYGNGWIPVKQDYVMIDKFSKGFVKEIEMFEYFNITNAMTLYRKIGKAIALRGAGK